MERGNARGIQGETPSGLGKEAQGGGSPRTPRGIGDAGKVGEAGTTAVVPARPTAVTVKRAPVIDAEGRAVGELDAAIARRRDELAVLERAKAIIGGDE